MCPLSGLKGVQPPLPFGERTRDCSPGHAGKEGPSSHDWFQIGKGVRQGCVLSPCIFNFYAECIYLLTFSTLWLRVEHETNPTLIGCTCAQPRYYRARESPQVGAVKMKSLAYLRPTSVQGNVDGLIEYYGGRERRTDGCGSLLQRPPR